MGIRQERFLTWLRHGFDGELLQLAAALSYTTLLAVVPLVTVVFSVLSLFPVFEQWSHVAERFIFENFVPTSGKIVSDYLQQFSAKAGRLTAIGLVTLLVTALLLLATIENALNTIWGVRAGRSPGQRVMVYWTLLTLGPIMIVASLAISSFLISRALLGVDSASAPAMDYVVPALPFVLELSSFVMMYYLVPNCRTRFLHAMIGAAIAATLFEFAKIGFTWYVSEFNSYEVIYGALGVIPIFLIWIYISWLVILIGARYAARLDKMRPVSSREFGNTVPSGNAGGAGSPGNRSERWK